MERKALIELTQEELRRVVEKRQRLWALENELRDLLAKLHARERAGQDPHRPASPL